MERRLSILRTKTFLALGGWNILTFILFIILYIIYLTILINISYLDFFGLFNFVIAFILATVSELFFVKKINEIREEQQANQVSKEKVQNKNKFLENIDKTKCISCGSKLESNQSKCSNCGYDYMKVFKE